MQTQNNKNLLFGGFGVEQIIRADLKHHEISRNKRDSTNITKYPYNCIGLLKFTNSNGETTLNGTAFLISCDLILTSAQNIYNKKEQSYFTNFQFIPSSNQKEYCSIKIRQFRVDELYIKSKGDQQSLQNCYGLLKLDKPIIRNQYFELRYNYAEESSQIYLYGFPKPLHDRELYGASGKIEKIQQSIIIHSIITQTGQSGSPIFIKRKQDYFLVGIHVGNTNKRGIGLLLTKEKMVSICKWERQMMVSQLKFGLYQSENQNLQSQHYSFFFEKCIIKVNNQLSDWKPLKIQWQIAEQNNIKLQIRSNKLIRFKKSLFDDRHKQVTSSKPLPTQGKYYIEFKVIDYGQVAPYDSIYFGIITEKHKKDQYSDGRSKGSMAYLTSPANFSSSNLGLGTILMDGRQISYGQDLYIQKGGQIRLEMNFETGEMTWRNGKKNVNFELSSKFTKKNKFLFMSLSKDKSSVSWRLNDREVWY